LRSCLRICKDKNFAADKDWRFHPSKSSSLQEAVLIMPTEFLQDHWAPICWCKAPTLIPTLPNIAQISKKKSCGLKGNLRLHGDDKQKHV
jgi:hypothetical protein